MVMMGAPPPSYVFNELDACRCYRTLVNDLDPEPFIERLAPNVRNALDNGVRVPSLRHSDSPGVAIRRLKATTSVAVTSMFNPVKFGASLDFTATVTGQSPSGTLTFNDGATAICTAVMMSGGSAPCTTSTLSVGAHSITAVYSGDNHNATSTSPIYTQQVNKNPTTTSLAANCMTTFVENQPFTMFALVDGAAPTGDVSFATQDNTVLCANVPLDAGNAVCITNALVTVGPATVQVFSLTASYSGDAGNTSSISNAIMVTVLKAADVVFRNGFEPDSASCPIE